MIIHLLLIGCMAQWLEAVDPYPYTRGNPYQQAAHLLDYNIINDPGRKRVRIHSLQPTAPNNLKRSEWSILMTDHTYHSKYTMTRKDRTTLTEKSATVCASQAQAQILEETKKQTR